GSAYSVDRIHPRQFFSLLIISSLIITTPGLDCYEALAQVITVNAQAIDCSITSHQSCPVEKEISPSNNQQPTAGPFSSNPSLALIDSQLRSLGIAPKAGGDKDHDKAEQEGYEALIEFLWSEERGATRPLYDKIKAQIEKAKEAKDATGAKEAQEILEKIYDAAKFSAYKAKARVKDAAKRAGKEFQDDINKIIQDPKNRNLASSVVDSFNQRIEDYQAEAKRIDVAYEGFKAVGVNPNCVHIKADGECLQVPQHWFYDRKLRTPTPLAQEFAGIQAGSERSRAANEALTSIMGLIRDVEDGEYIPERAVGPVKSLKIHQTQAEAYIHNRLNDIFSKDKNPNKDLSEFAGLGDLVRSEIIPDFKYQGALRPDKQGHVTVLAGTQEQLSEGRRAYIEVEDNQTKNIVIIVPNDPRANGAPTKAVYQLPHTNLQAIRDHLASKDINPYGAPLDELLDENNIKLEDIKNARIDASGMADQDGWFVWTKKVDAHGDPYGDDDWVAYTPPQRTASELAEMERLEAQSASCNGIIYCVGHAVGTIGNEVVIKGGGGIVGGLGYIGSKSLQQFSWLASQISPKLNFYSDKSEVVSLVDSMALNMVRDNIVAKVIARNVLDVHENTLLSEGLNDKQKEYLNEFALLHRNQQINADLIMNNIPADAVEALVNPMTRQQADPNAGSQDINRFLDETTLSNIGGFYAHNMALEEAKGNKNQASSWKYMAIAHQTGVTAAQFVAFSGAMKSLNARILNARVLAPYPKLAKALTSGVSLGLAAPMVQAAFDNARQWHALGQGVPRDLQGNTHEAPIVSQMKFTKTMALATDAVILGAMGHGYFRGLKKARLQREALENMSPEMLRARPLLGTPQAPAGARGKANEAGGKKRAGAADKPVLEDLKAMAEQANAITDKHLEGSRAIEEPLTQNPAQSRLIQEAHSVWQDLAGEQAIASRGNSQVLASFHLLLGKAVRLKTAAGKSLAALVAAKAYGRANPGSSVAIVSKSADQAGQYVSGSVPSFGKKGPGTGTEISHQVINPELQSGDALYHESVKTGKYTGLIKAIEKGKTLSFSEGVWKLLNTQTLYNAKLRSALKNIKFLIADEVQWVADSRTIAVLAKESPTNKVVSLGKIKRTDRIKNALESLNAPNVSIEKLNQTKTSAVSWDPTLDRPALNNAAMTKLTGGSGLIGWFLRKIGLKYERAQTEQVAQAIWQKKAGKGKQSWAPTDSEGRILPKSPSGQAQSPQTRFQDPYFEIATYLLEGFKPEQIKGKVTLRYTQNIATLPDTFAALAPDAVISGMSGSLKSVIEMVEAQTGASMVEIPSDAVLGIMEGREFVTLKPSSKAGKSSIPGLARLHKNVQGSISKGRAALVVDLSPEGQYGKGLIDRMKRKTGNGKHGGQKIKVYEITEHTPEGRTGDVKNPGVLDIADKAGREKALVIDYTKRSTEGIDWKGNLDTHGLADYLSAIDIEQLYGRGGRRPGTFTKGYLYYTEGSKSTSLNALGHKIKRFVSQEPLVKDLTSKLENLKAQAQQGSDSGIQVTEVLEALKKAEQQGPSSLTPQEKITLGSFLELAKTKSSDAAGLYHQNIRSQALIRTFQEALIQAQEIADSTEVKGIYRRWQARKDLIRLTKIYGKVLNRGTTLAELGIKDGSYQTSQELINKITQATIKEARPYLERALKKSSNPKVKEIFQEKINQIEELETSLKDPSSNDSSLNDSSFAKSKTLKESYAIGQRLAKKVVLPQLESRNPMSTTTAKIYDQAASKTRTISRTLKEWRHGRHADAAKQETSAGGSLVSRLPSPVLRTIGYATPAARGAAKWGLWAAAIDRGNHPAIIAAAAGMGALVRTFKTWRQEKRQLPSGSAPQPSPLEGEGRVRGSLKPATNLSPRRLIESQDTAPAVPDVPRDFNLAILESLGLNASETKQSQTNSGDAALPVVLSKLTAPDYNLDVLKSRKLRELILSKSAQGGESNVAKFINGKVSLTFYVDPDTGLILSLHQDKTGQAKALSAELQGRGPAGGGTIPAELPVIITFTINGNVWPSEIQFSRGISGSAMTRLMSVVSKRNHEIQKDDLHHRFSIKVSMIEAPKMGSSLDFIPSPPLGGEAAPSAGEEFIGDSAQAQSPDKADSSAFVEAASPIVATNLNTLEGLDFFHALSQAMTHEDSGKTLKGVPALIDTQTGEILGFGDDLKTDDDPGTAYVRFVVSLAPGQETGPIVEMPSDESIPTPILDLLRQSVQQHNERIENFGLDQPIISKSETSNDQPGKRAGEREATAASRSGQRGFVGIDTLALTASAGLAGIGAWVLPAATLVSAVAAAGFGIALYKIWKQNQTLKTENSNLRNLSFYDTLTKIPNRRYWNEKLTEIVARAYRTGEPMAVIMADIDDFKKVNDTYGHNVGDQALKTVAESIKENIRQGDFVARIGGEELAILLPNTDAQAARVVAERVLEKIRGIRLVISGKETVPLRASLGLALAPGDVDIAPNVNKSSIKDFSAGLVRIKAQELTQKADIALYWVKEHGKDNFEFYSNIDEGFRVARLGQKVPLKLGLARKIIVATLPFLMTFLYPSLSHGLASGASAEKIATAASALGNIAIIALIALLPIIIAIAVSNSVKKSSKGKESFWKMPAPSKEPWLQMGEVMSQEKNDPLARRQSEDDVSWFIRYLNIIPEQVKAGQNYDGKLGQNLKTFILPDQDQIQKDQLLAIAGLLGNDFWKVYAREEVAAFLLRLLRSPDQEIAQAAASNLQKINPSFVRNASKSEPGILPGGALLSDPFGITIIAALVKKAWSGISR
ncbi:MAG: GGDEF domain-containing protein, partial [Elusimicrobiota bacterium]